ncbi:hypothetical protein [Actinomyces sp. ZJ308]|uniref:restriction system modified-DNA reader domain-containing protein n=1 Tax=Actinomyces sp. ZJ308 TaxID=2708342 RepID=UPI001423D127|nr:hypothetical protein [Actinomyces sp. ZJ308]
MAMYELDGNHLLPVRLGRSADAITLSHSLVAIQRQIVDVLRRPLFPLAWDEIEGGASLTALDATGQVVVVEVLESVDSAGLLAAMSRLTQAAAAGRREIASRYAGGLGAFSEDWNEFREAMPAQVEAGPRLTILSASLEPDVVGGLGVLASSGLEIHEVDVRIVDESRIVVVVEKISGTDVAAGGPLLVARAPRPALAGSTGSAGGVGAAGSRAIDASEQAEQMSPVTGPIEIVLPQEDPGDGDATGEGIPAGAFAASGAADALSELFEPVAVTAEQPQVRALADQDRRDRAEDRPEAPEGPRDSAGHEDGDRTAADEPAADASTASVEDSAESAAGDSGSDTAGEAAGEPAAQASAGAAASHDDATDSVVDSDAADPESGARDRSNDSDDDDDRDHRADDEQPGTDGAAGSVDGIGDTDGGADRTAGGGVGRDLADILSGDSLAGPVTIDLDDEPGLDNTARDGAGGSTGAGAGRRADEPSRIDSADHADHSERTDRAGQAAHADRADHGDATSAEARAVAALAGGVDILGGSSLSGGGGSAASAGSAPSEPSHDADSRTRRGRRSRATQSREQESAAASPTSHAATSPAASGVPETGEHSAQAAEAWSTVAPNEARPDEPTGAVPLVSWEPLRGSADALDPVAEALGGDPSKSLLVQETAELAAVAATLGEPTQLIWQRLRRGIYHEAILSVEGVITLSDGRSFTDPTSAANAAQDVSDADGWRVWRVGVRGAHLGDLRDDLADRSS